MPKLAPKKKSPIQMKKSDRDIASKVITTKKPLVKKVESKPNQNTQPVELPSSDLKKWLIIAAFVISPVSLGLIIYFNQSRGDDSGSAPYEEAFDTKSGIHYYDTLQDAPADGILYQDRKTGKILDLQFLNKDYHSRITKQPLLFKKLN